MIEELEYTLHEMLKKLLSVRAVVTVIVIVTLCLAVFKCFELLTMTIVNEEHFGRIKDIVMFILGSFTSVVTMISTAYFNRSDRWRSNKPENENLEEGEQK